MSSEPRYLLNDVENLIAELNGIEEYSDRAQEIVSALYQLASQNPNISHYLENRMRSCTNYHTKIFLGIALMGGGNTSQAVD